MRNLTDRFSYHTTDEVQRGAMEEIRKTALRLAQQITGTVPEDEAGRAIDLVEQAMMIANAGISRGHPRVCQRTDNVNGTALTCQLPKDHPGVHYCDGYSW